MAGREPGGHRGSQPKGRARRHVQRRAAAHLSEARAGARFDVHRNLAASKAKVPYLLDVQADLLALLATRLVMPLARAKDVDGPLLKHLHIEVAVDGEPFVVVGTDLVSVPARQLGERVASLSSRRADLLRAIDVLVNGV